MFCPSCGVALQQHLKYCNHCGVQLASAEEAIVKKSEKRLDEYLDGLFWITVFGLGIIVGGTALIQKLQIGYGWTIGFLILSSAAFLVNFWLNLREVLRMTGRSKNPKHLDPPEELNTKELPAMNANSIVLGTPSVTENTTRELQTLSKKNVRQ